MSLQFYEFSRYFNILKLAIAFMLERAEGTLLPMPRLFKWLTRAVYSIDNTKLRKQFEFKTNWSSTFILQCFFRSSH